MTQEKYLGRTIKSDLPTIEVTQQDIDMGKQGSKFSCPIALAAHRKFGKKAIVNGILCTIYDENNYIEKSYMLSPVAEDFVYNFDRGFKVKPFCFKFIGIFKFADELKGILS